MQPTLPSHQAPPAVPFASHPQPPLEASRPLPPPTAPAAPPPAPVYPPGQTVDDLLMSILGATPLPVPVQHAPAPPAPQTGVAQPPPPVPVATKPGHENAAAAQSPTQSRQWARVGDSTFAQAAKIAATDSHAQSHMSPQPLPGMVPSPNLPAMTTPQAAHGRAGPSPLPAGPNGLPPAPPPGMQDAVAESMAARFGRSLSSEEKAAQGRFVAHLLELVHVRVLPEWTTDALTSPDRPGLRGWDMAGISSESKRRAGLSRSGPSRETGPVLARGDTRLASTPWRGRARQRCDGREAVCAPVHAWSRHTGEAAGGNVEERLRGWWKHQRCDGFYMHD